MQLEYTKKEFREWLESQHRNVICVVAARGALRLAPHLVGLLKEETLGRPVSSIVLPLFNGMATALCQGNWDEKYGNSSTTLQAASAADAAYTSSAATAAMSAAAAARAASTHDDIHAAASAYAASVSVSPELWQWDISTIESNGTVQSLVNSPLWPEGNIPNSYFEDWSRLKLFLLDLQEDWEVWTDWYEDRLLGLPLVKAIELNSPNDDAFGRISFPSDAYDHPASLNKRLKKVSDSFWQSSLKQDNTVSMFGISDNGKIVSLHPEMNKGLSIDSDTIQWYENLRTSVIESLELSHNVLGPTRRYLDELNDVLPENINDVNHIRLWSRANRIRRLLERHENIVKLDDYSPDLLSEECAHALVDVVSSYNNLRMSDPTLREFDNKALSPTDAEDIAEVNTSLKPIINELLEANVFQEDAKEIMQEILSSDNQQLAKGTLLDRLQLSSINKVLNNFAKTMVRYYRTQKATLTLTSISLVGVTILMFLGLI